MSAAGFVLWYGLSLVSPTAADPTTGHTYLVPGSRRSPDFYVRRFDAYALRITGGHMLVGLILMGAVGILNAGAKRRPPSESHPES
jgi:hypothetical protein